MAKKLYEESNIQAIADSIRAKNGTTTTYKTSEMAAAIDGITTGGEDTLAMRLNNTLTSYTYDEYLYQLPNWAFYKCTSLTSVSMSTLNEITRYVFSGCTGLQEINFPAVRSIGAYAFQGCTSLTEVYLPGSGLSLATSVFDGCSNLTKITLTNASSITDCMGASALETLILSSDTLVTTNIGTKNFFDSSSPIYNGTGYIYVPSSLIEEYKAHWAWSTWVDQFRAIEDYPDITGG